MKWITSLILKDKKPASDWINVNELLPGDEPVIGFDKFYTRVGEARLSSWDKKRLVFIDSDDCYITHWQPFPSPPIDDPASKV